MVVQMAPAFAGQIRRLSMRESSNDRNGVSPRYRNRWPHPSTWIRSANIISGSVSCRNWTINSAEVIKVVRLLYIELSVED